MVAFLAALPAILAAVSSATELFNIGKKVAEEVSGTPSKAIDVSGLKKEVENFTPSQSARFVERMTAELQAYGAITERISLQGGSIDAPTLGAIPEKERGYVAAMRMTTRPWAVRWMVIAVVFPPLASVTANLGISFYNVLNKAWAEVPRAIELISLGSVFDGLYTNMVGWAAGVIMTYMGMREIGKAVGHQDNVTISDVTGSLSGLIGNMKKVFN